MNRHQYPKIGSQRSYPLRNGKRQKGPPCIVCGVESWCKVTLETGHMRGDDEVVHACVGHKDDACALWAAFEQRQKARADVAVGDCCETNTAVKIIKRGKLPEEKIHRETCGHCKSELEFKHSEVLWSPDPRDGALWFVICPVCTRHVWGRSR